MASLSTALRRRKRQRRRVPSTAVCLLIAIVTWAQVGTIRKASVEILPPTHHPRLSQPEDAPIGLLFSASKPTIRTYSYDFGVLLMRAIGNSLPPRHSPNQTIVNLEFLLRREPNFPNVRKHWFVNRLVYPDIEEEVTRLLELYHQNFTVIPWIASEYLQIPYRFDRAPSSIDVDGIREALKDPSVYHEKLLYAVNVNGVRNSMLDYGSLHSNEIDNFTDHYLLPWDGNCILTQKSYQALMQGIQKSHPRQNYFLVPMDRLSQPNNEVALRVDYQPNPVEEPQVVLHQRAHGRFHPHLRYGYLNKLDFLYRVTGDKKWRHPIPSWVPSYEKGISAVDYGDITDQTIAGRLWMSRLRKHRGVPTISWTTRLYSGISQAEAPGTDTWQVRAALRDEGVVKLLEHLDCRAVIETLGAAGHYTTSARSLLSNTASGIPELVGHSDSHVLKAAENLLASVPEGIETTTPTVASIMEQITILVAAASMRNTGNAHDFSSDLKDSAILRAIELARAYAASSSFFAIPSKWNVDYLPYLPAFVDSMQKISSWLSDQRGNNTVSASSTVAQHPWQTLIEKWWHSYLNSSYYLSNDTETIGGRDDDHYGSWHDANIAAMALQTKNEALAAGALYRGIVRLEQIAAAVTVKSTSPSCTTDTVDSIRSIYVSHLTLARMAKNVLNWNVFQQQAMNDKIGDGTVSESNRVCRLLQTLGRCASQSESEQEAWSALQIETQSNCGA